MKKRAVTTAVDRQTKHSTVLDANLDHKVELDFSSNQWLADWLVNSITQQHIVLKVVQFKTKHN